MKRLATGTLLAAIVFLALWLDGATKQWAERMLTPHTPVPVLGEFFQFTLGYNTGTAFGLFAGTGGWLVPLTALIIAGMALWLLRTLRRGAPSWAVWPVGLIVGGALANFLDRLPDGRVTDFLDAGVASARWPTFNLADSFIVSGILVLVRLNLRAPTGSPAEPNAPPPPVGEPQR